MKLLYIPPNTANPDTDGLHEAFKKRCEVSYFWRDGAGDGFDAVYVQSGSVDIETLKRIRKENKKAIICQWDGDYRPAGLPYVRSYMEVCDYTFNSADVPGIYKGMVWLPHSVGDWQFKPVSCVASGVVMLANCYIHLPGGKERDGLARMLMRSGNFKGYGSGFAQSVDFDKSAEIYNRARFATGGNIHNDARKYFGNRPLNAMAGGTCYIMRWVPGIEEVFTHGVDCLVYETFEEVKHYIKEVGDDKRDQIARQGQKKVRENYHHDNFVNKILSYV